jgi:cobalt/nickel transport system permease protein
MSGLHSHFDRVDPAAKLITFLAAAVIVATTPGLRAAAFLTYAVIAAVLLAVSAASPLRIWKRLLALSPIVLLSAAMRAWQQNDAAAGLAVACKAGLVILLFAILTTTTPFSTLLPAMRRMGLPNAVGSVLALMDRYVHLMGEELTRMYRARASRTARAMGAVPRFRSEGQLFGALLLRSWNRSDNVYHAMLSRGFTGDWPTSRHRRWDLSDAAFLLATVAGFGFARAL